MHCARSFGSFLIACFVLSTAPALAQTPEEEVPTAPAARGPRTPTVEEWRAAGLPAEEYDQAVALDVPLEEWQEMHRSRRARTTAGWACVGTSLLGGAILTTIYLAKGWSLSNHPEQEVFIMSTVAAGATLITGVILLVSAPSPEDFRHRPGGPSHALTLGPVSFTPTPLGVVGSF